jgi:hypothetical protein
MDLEWVEPLALGLDLESEAWWALEWDVLWWETVTGPESASESVAPVKVSGSVLVARLASGLGLDWAEQLASGSGSESVVWLASALDELWLGKATDLESGAPTALGLD